MNSQKNQVRLLSVILMQFTCTNSTTAQEATHRRHRWTMSVCESLSHVQLFATSWTVVCQAPLSMGFSRPEYWSGLPLPSPRDLPNPGIKPHTLQTDSLPSEPPGKPQCKRAPIKTRDTTAWMTFLITTALSMFSHAVLGTDASWLHRREPRQSHASFFPRLHPIHSF